MRISGVKYLFNQGLKNIYNNKMMAFASFCVLLVSLLLVGFSILFYMNINTLVTSIEDKNEVVIFLNEDTTDEEIATMQNQLQNMDNVQKVVFYSKEEAYINLKDSMDEWKIVFDSLGSDNPLVDSFKVKVADISQMGNTVTQISAFDNILKIRAPYDFVSTLTQIKKIITIISVAIIVALIIVCMVIISNTTKASVFARRKEISIMKYVGATNMFIRIPFFIEGMITGIISGLIATLITWLTYDAVIDVINQEASLKSIIGNKGLISFNSISFTITVIYLVVGAFIGALGTTISTRKHLKV